MEHKTKLGIQKRKAKAGLPRKMTTYKAKHSYYNVVKVILEHYSELIVKISTVVKKNTDKCYKARESNSILYDDSNLLCMKIVKPISYKLNSADERFQNDNVDVGYEYNNMVKSITCLEKKL